MVSSRQSRSSEKLFDPIRRRLVEKTPEEVVRQRLVNYMSKCGFPRSLIAVEKSLKELTHLQHVTDSGERRIDVVCFARHIHPAYPLYPLLLAECKAENISMEAVEQALGYNAQIGAPFVLLACPHELRVYSPRSTNKQFVFVPHLLSYQELVQQARLLYEQ